MFTEEDGFPRKRPIFVKEAPILHLWLLISLLNCEWQVLIFPFDCPCDDLYH